MNGLLETTANSPTRSLTRSLDPSHRCHVKLSLIIPLISAQDVCGKGIVDRRKRGHFKSSALMFCIWSPLRDRPLFFWTGGRGGGGGDEKFSLQTIFFKLMGLCNHFFSKSTFLQTFSYFFYSAIFSGAKHI